MLYLFPYKQASNSAKVLAEAVGGRLIKLEGSKFKPGPRKCIINWGNNNFPVEYINGSKYVFNQDVKEATNKLSFFTKVAGKEWCIQFTTDKEQAQKWIDEGKSVVCRTLLNAHSGEGIVLSNKDVPLVDAPLYTQYIKKESEYRVHIFKNGAAFIQKKVRNKEVPDDQVNWQIRNHVNGFVFASGEEFIQGIPADIKNVAYEAIKLLGLDFGAVDVIWNDKYQQAYVLEVNSAPGLEPEGRTLEFYRNQFLYLDDIGGFRDENAMGILQNNPLRGAYRAVNIELRDGPHPFDNL